MVILITRFGPINGDSMTGFYARSGRGMVKIIIITIKKTSRRMSEIVNDYIVAIIK